MHFYLSTIALFASLSAASPNPAAAEEKPHIHRFQDFRGNDNHAGDNPKIVARTEEPRHTFVDYHGTDLSFDSGLAKRDDNENFVSSCQGSKYMTVDDFDNSDKSWSGYEEAVRSFCEHITSSSDKKATTLSKGGYSGSTVMDGYSLTDGTPCQISFEIHNKADGLHQVKQTSCVTYLMKIPESSCGKEDETVMNKKHVHVTKGGTYQIGKSAVSYHAFILTN